MENFVDYKEYRRIMSEEFKLRPDSKYHSSLLMSSFVTSAIDIRRAVEQIHEVAMNSTVQRSYIVCYHLDGREQFVLRGETIDGEKRTRNLVYESDAAHANLVSEIVDQALMACYGGDFGQVGSQYPVTSDGYTYRDIIKAARFHDLAENLTGDVPDNDSCDPVRKTSCELARISAITDNAPSYDMETNSRVLKLLQSMAKKDTPTGRLLYICDKLAATFMTLTYDSLGYPPRLRPSDPYASARDFDEMMMCDVVDEDGSRYASEMWTVDLLHIRNLIQYDDTGFITACLVMYTLMVRGKWYDWRERDYEAVKQSKSHP